MLKNTLITRNKIMKIILFLIFSMILSDGICQELNLQETVNYINKKLKENSSFQIAVTNDGYLVIYLQYSYVDSRCKMDVKKFLIKNARVDYESTGLVYPRGTIGFSGMGSVKEGSGECNSNNIQLSENYNYYSPYIKFSNDEIIHESLYNAFTHLFELVKSDSKYSPQSDSDDPFAPGNYKKSIQTSKPNIEPKSNSSNPKIPCNIQTVNRLDGTTVKYIKPNIVGVGNNCELGLGIQIAGQNSFLVTYVRYFNQPKKIVGNLRIKLSNDQNLELELYTSEFMTLQNENLAASIFLIKESDVIKFKDSGLKYVVFRESNNVDQIIMVNQNYDIIKQQLNCFGK